MATIIPAILTDSEEVYKRQLFQSEHLANLIQVDIIDGKFAGNKTIDAAVVGKYPTSSQLEIQLMVVEPKKFIEDFADLEYVSRIIVPFEIKVDLKEIFFMIKNFDKQVGLSLNPKSAISQAQPLFSEIDLLLLLAVEPGFSGQKLQEKVIDKIIESKNINPEIPIEVDGGVNFENASKLSEAGANFLAANSVLFKAPDVRVAFEKLSELAS